MIAKQIIFSLLLIAIIYFTLRVIYGLLVFVFRKDKSAMYVASFDRHLRLLKEIPLVPGKRLVDLGCGDGKAMRFFAREFGLICDGYDFKRFPLSYGKLINSLLGYHQLKFYHKDFSQANLGHYDYIYLYLLPQQMVHIESWVFEQIAPHTIIISNSFPFAVHTPYEVIKDAKGKPSIYLYKAS